MGCREAIFVDKSTFDFPIFLLFFNAKFPIFQIIFPFYFSYFLNPEFPIFLFFWATMPLDTLVNLQLNLSGIIDFDLAV